MSATPRQIDLIDRLLAERVVPDALRTQVYAICKRADAGPQMGGEISRLIDGLMKLPKLADAATGHAVAPRAASANAEPGYYLRADGAAIVVVKTKDGERTYGKRFTPRPGQRPEWRYERGLGISVAELTPMTAADAARLGLSHGYCIRCCAELGGATLSAHVSAVVGYGETCARREGWPYPTGAAAQRAALAAAGAAAV